MQNVLNDNVLACLPLSNVFTILLHIVSITMEINIIFMLNLPKVNMQAMFILAIPPTEEFDRLMK